MSTWGPSRFKIDFSDSVYTCLHPIETRYYLDEMETEIYDATSLFYFPLLSPNQTGTQDIQYSKLHTDKTNKMRAQNGEWICKEIMERRTQED